MMSCHTLTQCVLFEMLKYVSTKTRVPKTNEHASCLKKNQLLKQPPYIWNPDYSGDYSSCPTGLGASFKGKTLIKQLQHKNRKALAVKVANTMIRCAKQVGTLYHYTSFANLLKILESDKLFGHSQDGISFTRSKNLHRAPTVGIYLETRLNVDGDKLSNKYRLVPFLFHGSKSYRSYEAEERVKSSQITRFRQYIQSIIVFANKWKASPAALDAYVKKLEKYGIPVKVDIKEYKRFEYSMGLTYD